MTNKGRERNIADIFSDYGLDERQKAININAAYKGLKASFYIIMCISLLCMCLYAAFPGLPGIYGALMSYGGALAGLAYYGIKASEHGGLNPIFTFSSMTGGILACLFWSVLFAVKVVKNILGNLPLTDPNYAVALGVLFLAAYQGIMVWCAKRNDAALNEQLKEEDSGE